MARFTNLSATERRTLPPAIAVSTVAFAVAPPEEAHIGSVDRPSLAAVAETTEAGDRATQTTLWIPLVRRTREPFKGSWALPGGPTEWNETLTDTATRTIHDAVRRPPTYLEQLYSFGAVERSADAQRLVTIAYWAQYGERDLDAAPSLPEPTPAELPDTAEDAQIARRRWDDVVAPAPTLPERKGFADPDLTADPNVAWFSADRLPELAFDHDEIVQVALWRLRIKTEYSSVAHRFLGPEFTLTELRRVHEAILGSTVDPANFRRQMLASGTLVETGDVLTGTAHRPARLYRFRDAPDRSPDGGPGGQRSARSNAQHSPQTPAKKTRISS